MAREALETQQSELKELVTRLEQDRELELEEREKLEEEIRAKEAEIEQVIAIYIMGPLVGSFL